VHFDFHLAGCAGIFGGASADMHMTARTYFFQQTPAAPAKVSAFLEGFTIDAVSSPFSQGDADIRNGLTQAFNGEFGTDLVNKTLDNTVTLVALLVDLAGQANAYIEPLRCSTTGLVRRGAPPASIESALAQIRRLRDEQLARAPYGNEFSQVVGFFAAMLTTAIRSEADSSKLFQSITQFVVRNFHEGVDLSELARHIDAPARRAVALLDSAAKNGAVDVSDRLLPKCVKFVREELSEHADFQAVMKSLTRLLKEEQRHVVKRREGR
jgi:hypothetical protein